MKKRGLAEETRGSTAKDDFDYAIGLNRLIFAPLGVWPLDENPSMSETVARRIRLVVTSWIILSYVAPQYCYLLSQPAVGEFFQVVPDHVVFVLSITKLIIFVLYSDKIGYCIGRMKEDWNNVWLTEDREAMIRYAKVGRYMAICCVGCTYSGLCFYTVLVPFLKDPTTKIVGNVSIANRPLPFRINYIIFDAETTPIYEITWVIQFFGMSCICILNCGSHALTGALVAHACGQLRVIGSRLENLVDGDHTDGNQSVQQRLGATVQHHLRVIRYTAYINQSLQVFFLTDEFGTLTVICFVAYLLLLVIMLCDVRFKILRTTRVSRDLIAVLSENQALAYVASIKASLSSDINLIDSKRLYSNPYISGFLNCDFLIILSCAVIPGFPRNISSIITTIPKILLHFDFTVRWARNDTNNSALFSLLFFYILCSFTFNFFTISIAGQQLWEESEAVGAAASRVQWYRLHPKVARCLLVCMVRAARPLKLSACNMFDMSLSNFGDVIRGAYVFLNVVRKTTGMD